MKPNKIEKTECYADVDGIRTLVETVIIKYFDDFQIHISYEKDDEYIFTLYSITDDFFYPLEKWYEETLTEGSRGYFEDWDVGYIYLS